MVSNNTENARQSAHIASPGIRSYASSPTPVAAGQMIVHKPAGLHTGIRRGGTDKDKTVSLQGSCQLNGLCCGRRDISRGTRLTVTDRREGPEQLIEPTVLTQPNYSLGVGDCGPDLQPVAHDGGVGRQPFDVGLTEGRNSLGIEPGEGRPETLTLAQDRQPGKP